MKQPAKQSVFTLCSPKNVPTLLALILLFLFSSSTSAQEYVKQLQFVKTDTSIVRNIDNTSKLLYNSTPAFHMFDNSSTNSIDMNIDPSFAIRDFEIDGQMVYFCGHRYLPLGNKVAVFGFFDLNSYPNSQVFYYQHDDYTSFEYLDYYKNYDNNETELHVVMSAIDNKGDQNVIDSYELPSGAWLFWDMSGDLTNHKITDIEVTPNYVLVASTMTATSLYKAHLWYFTRPGYLGGTMFDVYAWNLLLDSLPAEQAKLEQCENNWFVVAYTNGLSNVRVLAFDGLFHHYSLRIPSLLATGVVDVKYNRDSRETDLLLSVTPKLNMHSNIFYHLPQTVNYGGALSGHSYRDDIICSFDYDGADHYIASGNEINTLTLYHYKYDIWEDCFDMVEQSADSQVFLQKPQYLDIGKRERYFWRREMEVVSDETSIIIKCDNNQ